jgi:uncharacterized protein
MHPMGRIRARSLPLPSRLPPSTEARGPAPSWHLGLLVFVIVGVAATGTLLDARRDVSRVAVSTPLSLPWAYVPAIFVQWCLVFYVCRLGRDRNVLIDLIGARWTSAARAFGDVGLAAFGFLFVEAAELVSARFLGSPSGSVRSILPVTSLDRWVWGIFAISAGIGEEIVYRGYLETELGARARSPFVGVLLQALLFGAAHAEQGAPIAARFAVYGLGLGLLARLRRSLLPGMLCHVSIDLASGLWPR